MRLRRTTSPLARVTSNDSGTSSSESADRLAITAPCALVARTPAGRRSPRRGDPDLVAGGARREPARDDVGLLDAAVIDGVGRDCRGGGGGGLERDELGAGELEQGHRLAGEGIAGPQGLELPDAAVDPRLRGQRRAVGALAHLVELAAQRGLLAPAGVEVEPRPNRNHRGGGGEAPAQRGPGAAARRGLGGGGLARQGGGEAAPGARRRRRRRQRATQRRRGGEGAPHQPLVLGMAGEEALHRRAVVVGQGAQRPGVDLLEELGLGHDSPTISSSSKPARRDMPARTRLLSVPSATPSWAAVSLCDRPP